MQLPERIWGLIARKLTGEASVKDLKQLDSILSSTPELGSTMELLEYWWRIEIRQEKPYALQMDRKRL